jgi:hypothetical protein
MSGGAVIIIIDPTVVRSNRTRKETIDTLRAALDELEGGKRRFDQHNIQASVTDEHDED